MSGDSQRIDYPGANHRFTLRREPKLRVTLILRSDAQHRVSKDDPESVARLASPRAPFEAASRRLRARGSGLLKTGEESR
jgi:hypothetical protein